MISMTIIGKYIAVVRAKVTCPPIMCYALRKIKAGLFGLALMMALASFNAHKMFSTRDVRRYYPLFSKEILEAICSKAKMFQALR